MKKQNRKLMTMILASAFCAATIGGVAAANNVVASAEAQTYALTDVFASSRVELGADKDNATLTAFNFSDDGAITLKRNLAFKWYEGKNDARYLTVKFAFKDLDFKTVSFEVESESAWATENEKTKNVVTFEKTDSGVTAKVNDGAAVDVAVEAGVDVTLALTSSVDQDGAAVDGEFGVNVTVGAETKEIGKFVNVGANLSKYVKNDSEPNKAMLPLVIKADLAEGEKVADVKSTLLLKEINKQKFDNIKMENDKAVVTDTAAPVLVVLEDISGFLLGTAFSVDYEKVDVLQSSGWTDTKTYYQYNPTDTEKKYETLTTSIYFMDTVYEKDGKQTTVFAEEGKEYVSIKIKLGDKAFTADSGEWAKAEYDLSWYASEVETKDEVDYIVIDRNEDGATYNHLVLDDENKVNKIVNETEYEESVKNFQAELNKAAEGVYAGSNSYLYIPSLKWLINDNNGYRNLKFTISYKTPSSDTAKSSTGLSHNGLKLATSNEGMYEFKVFAIDKAGNTMKYYIDGELVELSTSNVWDIEEIPSFTFEIANLGLKLDSEDSTSTSSKKATEDIGEKYTMSSMTIVGATNLQQNHALYRIDEAKANAIGLDESVLTSVTYKTLREKAATRLSTVENDNYFDLYLTVYAEAMQTKLDGVSVDKIKACFVEIEEFDSRIDQELHADEWEKNNKYNWSASSRSFTAAESGLFVIVGDYWEGELPQQRVTAYKVVVVESEVDEIGGATTSWIKNNIVSVILFAVAGVMLILIIILLLVKPSEETLDEVDEKAEKKASKKKNK